MRKKVLITGGCGYVGSHTAQYIFDKNEYDVLIIDNFSTGSKDLVFEGPKYFNFNLLDKKKLQSFFKKHKIYAVIHFASNSLVGESFQKPSKYLGDNVQTTLNILECMRIYGVSKIVFSSSAAVYGKPTLTPISEDHELQPINIYGLSKKILEEIIESYKIYGISSICLRYFNAAGASSKRLIGELHDPETHLIPNILKSIIKEKKYDLKIFGNNHDTPDGTCIRDYVHVDDLAIAHFKSLDYLEGKMLSEKINLGTGAGLSVLSIIESVRKVLDKNINFTFEKERVGDPPQLIASNKKAKKILKWEPKFSDIDTIISSAFNFHSEYINK